MSNQDLPLDNTVVLDIAGKVTIGHDAKMREAIVEAAEAGAMNILLDMSRASSLDSSGVGELVSAHLRMQRLGGRLLLIGLPNRLATVLQITALIGVLETYDDIDAALTALSEGDS